MNLANITFDCADPPGLATFWAAALGWQVDPTPPVLERILAARPDLKGARSSISDPRGRAPRIWFQRVPEPKQDKNRLHLDCEAGSRSRDSEVNRLLSLGATLIQSVTEQLGEYTGTHTVMADPEGNEFCLH